MAKKAKKAAPPPPPKKGAVKAKTAAPPPKPAPKPPPSAEAPIIVTLRGRISGDVWIRLRILEPSYTAEKLAKLLNDGNATWDVGDPARYHRIEKSGKMIAEIEQAIEDMHWERYQVD